MFQKNNLKNIHKKTGMFLFGKELVIKREVNTRTKTKTENKKTKIKNVLDNIPKGATHTKDGMFFKFGSHGFLYMFTNNTWQRCSDINEFHLRRI